MFQRQDEFSLQILHQSTNVVNLVRIWTLSISSLFEIENQQMFPPIFAKQFYLSHYCSIVVPSSGQIGVWCYEEEKTPQGSSNDRAPQRTSQQALLWHGIEVISARFFGLLVHLLGGFHRPRGYTCRPLRAFSHVLFSN